MGDRQIDIGANHDIPADISAVTSLNSKLIAPSTSPKDPQCDNFSTLTTKVDVVEEKKLHLAELGPSEDNRRDRDLENDDKLPSIENTDDNCKHVNGSPNKENGEYVRHSIDKVDCIGNDDEGDENDNGGNLEENESETQFLEVIA